MIGDIDSIEIEVAEVFQIGRFHQGAVMIGLGVEAGIHSSGNFDPDILEAEVTIVPQPV